MKKAYTIEQQIRKFKSRGMTFGNEERAKKILLDVGYYHIGFYSFPFEIGFPSLDNRSHKFKPGTTFESVCELYTFDAELRRILLNALDRIEVNIRTTIIYYLSLRYIDDPYWFVNPRIMKQRYIDEFETEVYGTIRKNPVIKHHHAFHDGEYAPAWKTIEFMTIGNLVSLYDALLEPEAKDLVSNNYGCSRGAFYNYLETIRVLRNKCAHGGCIYRMDFPKGIKKLPANVSQDCRHNANGAISVMRYILGFVSVEQKAELEANIRRALNAIESPMARIVVEQCSKIDI